MRNDIREISIKFFYSYFLEDRKMLVEDRKMLDGDIMDRLINLSSDKDAIDKAFKVVMGFLSVERNVEEIFEEIFGKKWKNLSAIERSIIATAVGERVAFGTPWPIIIVSAIRLSKKYCATGSYKFINFFLDKAKDLIIK